MNKYTYKFVWIDTSGNDTTKRYSYYIICIINIHVNIQRVFYEIFETH